MSTSGTVRARMPSSGALGAIDHEARTEPVEDPQGHFWLEDLEYGNWIVRVNAEGYAESREVEVTIPDSTSTELDDECSLAIIHTE